MNSDEISTTSVQNISEEKEKNRISYNFFEFEIGIRSMTVNENAQILYYHYNQNNFEINSHFYNKIMT